MMNITAKAVRPTSPAPASALPLALAGLVGALLAMLGGTGAWGEGLNLPQSAKATFENDKAPARYNLPIGPYAEGVLPTERYEGRVTTQSWRLPDGTLTPLQLIAPLRAQLRESGYTIRLDCAASTCGGFDFRFAIPVVDAPDMEVSLSDFHFLSASREGSAVTVLTSRTRVSSFLQIVRVSAQGSEALSLSASGKTPVSQAPPPQLGTDSLPLAQSLTSRGYVVLSDLEFKTGSSALGDKTFASLTALADYLRAHPDHRVVLVGHTDSVGKLESNIALSRKRAASVVARLRDRHDIPKARISAQGVGYLSPLTTNSTEAGREQNRRVEAILLSP